MLIELKGFGVENKGGELMYLAVVDALERAGLNATLAVEPRGDFRARMHYPLLTKFWFTKGGVQFGPLGRVVPQAMRSRFGIILDSETEAILDASGFAYGDTWGAKKTHERLGRYIETWKRSGKKIVLLPQAFGPFEEPGAADAMRQVLEHADLVFARDPQSRSYLDALGNYPCLRSAPDFTNLLHPPKPDDFDESEHRFCIIPNSKMLEKSSSDESETYLQMMADTVSTLVEEERAPYILIHESRADGPVAKEILKRSRREAPVVERTCPLAIKGIIGSAQAVLSSRFHGVVSALSQAVPTISTSWSHKYQMLMEDYSVSENLVGLEPEKLSERIQAFSSEEYLAELRQRETDRGLVQRERASAMWDEVSTLLRS